MLSFTKYNPNDHVHTLTLHFPTLPVYLHLNCGYTLGLLFH